MAPTTFRQLMEQLAEIGDRAANEGDTGIDAPLVSFGELAEQLLQEAKTGRKGVGLELEKWLDKRTPEELIKLRTYMYFGRDEDENDLHALQDHLIDRDGREQGAKRTIMEKSISLGRYFREAIRKADEMGLDVESPI